MLANKYSMQNKYQITGYLKKYQRSELTVKYNWISYELFAAIWFVYVFS